MNLDELKAQIEKLENGSQLMEAITELINIEKTKGITEKNKVNNEAANLRKFKKAMESLGYDGSADLDQFTADILSKKDKNDQADSVTLKVLNDKLRAYEQKLADSEMKAKHSTLSAKLTQALNDKLYGSNYVIKSLIQDGVVDLDGENVVFKYGDDVLDFNNGIKKVLESNKDIVKSTQNSGTGGKNQPTVNPDIDQIIKSGDKDAIRANLAAIKQQIGINRK